MGKKSKGTNSRSGGMRACTRDFQAAIADGAGVDAVKAAAAALGHAARGVLSDSRQQNAELHGLKPFEQATMMQYNAAEPAAFLVISQELFCAGKIERTIKDPRKFDEILVTCGGLEHMIVWINSVAPLVFMNNAVVWNAPLIKQPMAALANAFGSLSWVLMGSAVCAFTFARHSAFLQVQSHAVELIKLFAEGFGAPAEHPASQPGLHDVADKAGLFLQNQVMQPNCSRPLYKATQDGSKMMQTVADTLKVVVDRLRFNGAHENDVEVVFHISAMICNAIMSSGSQSKSEEWADVFNGVGMQRTLRRFTQLNMPGRPKSATHAVELLEQPQSHGSMARQQNERALKDDAKIEALREVAAVHGISNFEFERMVRTEIDDIERKREDARQALTSSLSRLTSKAEEDELFPERDHARIRGECAGCKQLVTTKLLECARCGSVRYCSKACQKADWKSHKPVCRPVASSALEIV